MSELQYVPIHAKYGQGVAELQKICLPNTPPEYHFTPEDVAEMAAIFPEGAFVVLDGEKVVGLGAGIFLDFDFEHTQHTLYELTGESACKNHNPDGAYYYGTDITVHPDYRRRGIGQHLYELRKEVTRRYNKKGIVAGGMLPGFVDHKAHMSADEYVKKVMAGELYDRTLTFQIGNGFKALGVLKNYYPDAPSDGWASLIVWENPEYVEEGD
jgi:ribosomal protein S18 acetylase RimI-like enzyme